MFPIHMVVAIPLPLIFLKLSTCIPHANDVSELAKRLRRNGKNATAIKISASIKTEPCRQ